ncbi:MAG: hypothetical protein U9N11_01865 [Campylobacterota bacterium]|nr:hypothetical protein [Campylobacterota bacterium]
MPHYDITIIGMEKECTSLSQAFKSSCKVLFLHTFRNTIKNKKGYTIVFNKEKKCMQVSTDILIKIS